MSAALVFVALHAAAETRFVTPGEGAQTFGAMPLEVSTDRTAIDRVDFYVDGQLVGSARRAPYRTLFDFGDGQRARRVEAVVYSDTFKNTERSTMTTAGSASSEVVHVDLVEVPFRTANGKAPRASQLKLLENGKAQEIREVLAQRPPTRFVFVVDKSLSMSDGKLAASLQAVRRAQKHLRPDDSASAILFNHRVEPLRSVNELTDAGASGGTSLRDALLAAVRDERTVIVAISDGADRNSLSTATAAREALTSRNVQVHALLFGGGDGESLLRDVTARTGGSLARSSAATIDADLDRIMRELNSRFTAVYQSSNSQRGWRNIELRATGSRVTALRKGYLAR